MTKLYPLAFALGLATLGWIAAGFAGTSWLALLMTAAIAAVYLLGALELRQFRGTTAALRAALQRTTAAPASLAEWLQDLPAALRHTVRLRLEGERAGLPGPALSPYLVGLLVMLGMLGTFLGMIVTFRGAVFALEGSTDLQAIRAALAAPVRGLGLSFGTSVAGVAASATLGLMLAIARRERMEAGRELDHAIGGVLQPFSLAHQRQASLQAMQGQAHALPAVVDKLDTMLQRMEARSQQLDEQLLQRHGELQRALTGAYGELAQRVGTALTDTVAASGKATAEAVRPVLERTLAQLGADAQGLHERLAGVAQAQLEALSTRFDASTRSAAQAWSAALEQHGRSSAALTDKLDAQLDAWTHHFAQRSAELVTAVRDSVARDQATHAEAQRQALQAWSDTLAAMGGELQAQWRQLGTDALARQQAASASLEQAAHDFAAQAGAHASHSLQQAAALLQQSQELVRARAQSEARWSEEQAQRMDQIAGVWRAQLQALREDEAQRGEAALAQLQALRDDEAQRGEAALAQLQALRQHEAQRIDGVVAGLQVLREDEAKRGEVALAQLQALRQHEAQRIDSVVAGLQALRDDEAKRGEVALAQLQALRQHEAHRIDSVVAALQGLREEEARRAAAAIAQLQALRDDEAQRAQGVIAQLQGLRADEAERIESAVAQLQLLRQEEQLRGDAAVARLEALRHDEQQRGEAAVARLGELQAAVAAHLATLGAALEAPLTRLLQTASEVPQAAAGVIAQLRQEMGRLAERDNLALQERQELMERLRALLDAVARGTTEQRAASEALVASAASVLEQAGARFAAVLEGQAGKAADAAAHVAAGALEVASLAEAFGLGIERFQAGNDKLVESLERMEASLRRSTARSDEQLAYYVAQAREVIDLSIASQQDLVESLRQLRGKPAAPAEARAALAEGARA